MAQDLTTVTSVVVLANAITGVVSAAMLLLVFWQNPRGKSNQYFSVTMLGLTFYSVFNIISRFSPSLELDPELMTNITGTLYTIFVVGLFFFSIEFAALDSRTIRSIRLGVLITALLSFAISWLGWGNKGITPVPRQRGSYETQLTPVGTISFLVTFSYPLVTAIILYRIRQQAPRLRYLWLASALTVAGLLWLMLFWRRTFIPLNAIFLAGTAFVVGWSILRENLFNPLADISHELQEKNVQLREADYVKNQFLAKMSHELRTPLNSIIGYTDLILEGLYGDVNQAQKDRLEKVLRNGRNLLNLINDILDLSHIEVGQVSLHIETISTQELLEGVIGVVEPQLQGKNLQLIREFENAPAIEADKVRTRQIITNILSNAVKFTNEGQIRVRAFEQGDMVQFEFEDTGIGIPADKHQQVFDEFRQIDNSSTRVYGGTGLGMSITKRLTEMHGGKIWLISEVGKGTTFFITLPKAGTELHIKPEVTHPTSMFSKKRLKILIIDDMQDAQVTMRDAILAQRADWQVITAASGRDGLRMASEAKPDVITLDIMMPSMDGWEVLKILKADERLADIPVMIVSMIDNYELAYQLGAAHVHPKPIDRKTFIPTLEKLARGEVTAPNPQPLPPSQ